MKIEDLFIFKLGSAVSTKDDPKSKRVIVERLFVEFLDVNKPRRIMYACRDFTVGETILLPQQVLEMWHETRKIQLVSKSSKIGGI